MNKFKKFKNAYNEMILESYLLKLNKNKCKIPSFSENDKLYTPKTENEFINAFKNIKFIYDKNDDDLLYVENIINESPGSIDYPGTLCEHIFSLSNDSILSNKEILYIINKNWKYYNELKQFGTTLKIFKFDFSNKKEMLKNFYIPGINDNIKNKFINSLYENCSSQGAFIPFDDLCIFIFNKNNYSKKTILHEFTHYLQYILNVEKIDINENIDSSKLEFLKLNSGEIKTLINILNDENEIIPYVNEFCEDVMNVFKEYQKINSIEWSNSFFDFFIKTLLNSNDIYNEELLKVYKKVTNDLTPLYVTLGCFTYNIDIERIKHILYEENKWIENNERSN